MKIKITNPDKILFPKYNITKMELINYYVDVINLIMPHVENRLLSVIRCHGNVEEEWFFKKHLTTEKDVGKLFRDDDQEYFYINEPHELINQVQYGTIEFHPWGSKVDCINNPDFMVFDLDPDRALPLDKLRKAVLKVKSILDELKLKSFLKTSGGKGYHVVVPFKCDSWEKFYDIAKQVAVISEQKWPKDFTTNIKKSERKGKIFLDYLRNNRGSTCAAPYTVRAREGAPISYPIDWSDLYKIKPDEINIKNYKKYNSKEWKSFFIVSQGVD